ncbi:MAG: class C beta-lactamase-related serine hydrolase [Chitinophagaceae bacterium]|nr:MAG: class C beta-lactamase-related serine hydrolase [Chitinophagaceae bacterium]
MVNLLFLILIYVVHTPGDLINLNVIKNKSFQILAMKKIIYLLLFVSPSLFSQVILPRSTPEAEGVSSPSITAFYEAVSKSRNELHGFVFVRHGKIIADAWSKPYADSLKHTMYSTSKSFTSTAIGFAVSERKLSVNDKVISFFPDDLPADRGNFLQNLTVKHLLTMTVGHPNDPTGAIIPKAGWVKSFLATAITDTPGTKFLYNSMATFMLSAIVQKVTGEKVIDYLEPRLFKPLGINNKDWETNPEGINVGGWGLRIRTMDMAKLGQLYLQKGKWNGKQVLPASWVEEASTAHIIQDRSATQEQRSKSDWLQGYGYQFWRSRYNSFRADGAFGQYILIFPELDAVIAITSETPDMQDELNLVWKHLYPAMKAGALPANKSAVSGMKKSAAALMINPFKIAADTTGSSLKNTSAISNRTVKLKKNDNDIAGLSFNVSKDIVKVQVQTSGGIYPLVFGQNEWVHGSTSLKGPGLTARAANSMEGLPPLKVTGRFRWKNATTLELVLQYVESPHREIWTCYFDENNFKMEIRNSIATMKEDKIDETLVEAGAL